MEKKTGKWNEVVIDEDKQIKAPTFFQRIKHVIMAVFMGAIFAQVMLLAFRMGSVVIYFYLYAELMLVYLLVCAILGWFYGEKFIQTLGKQSENWWDLWRDWY